MPRPPRFTYPRAVHHVTLRCNNREFLFDPASFELFLVLLQETRRRFPLSLFHYCLMTNHVHSRPHAPRGDAMSGTLRRPLPQRGGATLGRVRHIASRRAAAGMCWLLPVGCADTLSTAMHWLSTTFVGRFNRAPGGASAISGKGASAARSSRGIRSLTVAALFGATRVSKWPFSRYLTAAHRMGIRSLTVAARMAQPRAGGPRGNAGGVPVEWARGIACGGP